MNNQHDRLMKALGLIRTAYKDYIAARVLLNKNYILQGVILASTAIEKYAKALIVIHNGPIRSIHMDKLELLKQAIESIGYQVVWNKMDPKFLDILSKVYPLRYYDNVRSPTSIGFFKNQFLGELDHAVYWFDKALPPTDEDGTLLSPFLMDMQRRNPDLLENNWLAQEPKNRKKFMETDTEAFAIYLHPQHIFSEVTLSSKKVIIPYNGSMTLIDVQPDTPIDR